ncbi:alpha/beta fold hydrolase [Priestia megaterium]|uniref:alpha/beta fold hydrolase n=2 Tax=Priestia megaterium TaxID=1404 RepID=UPI00336B561A
MQYTTNDCVINYESFGEGTPVLFLHGYRLDKDSLQLFFESKMNSPIFDTFKRIYIDLPGMGDSTVSRAITNSSHVLECLNKFVQHFIGNKKFLVVGQSYGGYLAQGLLKIRSEQIEGVFLMCPVVKANFTERTLPTQSNHIISGFEQLPKGQHFEDFLNNNIKINPENWYRFNNEIIKGLQKGNHSFLNDLGDKGYKFNFEQELFELVFEQPTYVVAGKQDKVVGFSDMLFFLHQYTNCHLHVLNNAGHNIQIDQSSMVIQLFYHFLEEVKICNRSKSFN